jgi:hypothetical protein
MKSNLYLIHKQRGMSTLIISTLLLFAISLISLFSTKSIVLEQKISANAYRSEQAFFNADAAINTISAALNQIVADTKQPKQLQLDNAVLLQLQQESFGLAEVTQFSANPQMSTLNVIGYSDDKSSIRPASQLIAAVPIAGNGTGKAVNHPLISRLGIELNDQLFIKNTYAAKSIWSGGDVFLGDSATYISPIINSAAGEIELPITSGSGLSNGIDIIEKDFKLRQFSTKAFFENFLNESASFIKRLAKDNSLYLSVSDVSKVDGKSGLIWLGDGEKQITLDNAQIGTKSNPVIMIVDSSDGVFTTRGDITLYGLLYIRGHWSQTGRISVYGAVIVEGKMLATIDPELVDTTIHYQPENLNPQQPLTGTLSRVIGSWKDF